MRVLKDEDGIRTYTKDAQSRVTVGEAQQIATRSTVPAFIAARFALVASVIALCVAAVALAVALRR